KTPAKSAAQAAFEGIASLIRLLPTGTVFAFQFLNPVLTNDGKCHVSNKYLSGILIAICGLSCFVSSFTDSYTDGSGNRRYGIATRTGLWPGSPVGGEDLSSYRLTVGDFVHAFFALDVFAVVALLDPNSVRCFYPSFETTQRALVMALPPVIGAISGTVFVIFPNRRHGIGYPSDDKSKTS
ncbi:hypothetical protein M569_13571, partial [Genlisea aurea]